MGHDVSIIDFRDVDRKQAFHAVFHLEVVAQKALWWSEEQYWIPNPDWTKPAYLEFADAFRAILCKTHDAVTRLNGHKRVSYLGFESEDRWRPDIPRERRFFHTWGGSIMRGTRSVLRAWGKGEVAYPATFIYEGKLDGARFEYEQNRCLFWLQPSLVEGFGHCIHEGLGIGALIATTNGPPMNEPAGLAARIPARRVARQNLADVFDVLPQAVADAAYNLWHLSDAEVTEKSAMARAAFLEERQAFRARLKELFA